MDNNQEKAITAVLQRMWKLILGTLRACSVLLTGVGREI